MQHHNALRDIPPLLFINRQHLSNFQANDSQQSKMTVFPYFLLRQLPNTPWHYVIGFSPKKSKMTPNPCYLPPPFQTASDGFLPAIDALLFGDSFWQMLLMRENTSCIMYSEAVWLWSSSTHLRGRQTNKRNKQKKLNKVLMPTWTYINCVMDKKTYC